MKNNRVGVWIIGVLGSVAATVITGALALRKGLIPSTGMITVSHEFMDMGLTPVDEIEFGGCDVRGGNIHGSVQNLFKENRAVDRRIFDEIEEELVFVERNICRGTARNCGEIIEALADETFQKNQSLREEIDLIRKNLSRFREDCSLSTIVVVNLASTEPLLDVRNCHGDLEAFEGSLDMNEVTSVRASTLYAYAAIQEGCPYINFNPSNGALIPAIIQLAQQKGVPVMGNDGKTGETLVKSALAPLFTSRNLEVLSWEGFNILGNMDGKVLNHPSNKETKIKSKDQTLKKILGYSPHSNVSIDYVPSLGDQKTAWDFIHFKGFMGATMSLQFVWQGYDSILAAPLVLDLVRLAEFAMRKGEAGLMPHLALFFKLPLGVNEYRLSEQYAALKEYVKQATQNRKTLHMVK